MRTTDSVDENLGFGKRAHAKMRRWREEGREVD
jgi:hypothetical protein